MHKQRQSVSAALARLRLAVLAGCWLVGVALAVQMLIWSLSMFTDLRVERLEQARDTKSSTTPLIIENKDQPSVVLPTFGASDQGAAVDVNIVLSRWDRMFSVMAKLARGAGLLAVLVLVPFVAVGVLLAAGSATPGVERTVSAFCWAVLVGTLVMPLGDVIGLPWTDGALVSYEPMAAQVDRVRDTIPSDRNATAQAGDRRIIMYMRYLALPGACIMGVFLIGLNFSGGVELAIVSAREAMKLDPELELECSNRKAGSLLGSRAGRALASTMAKDEEPDLGPSGSPIPGVGPSEPAGLPRAREVSPGQAPKRLI